MVKHALIAVQEHVLVVADAQTNVTVTAEHLVQTIVLDAVVTAGVDVLHNVLLVVDVQVTVKAIAIQVVWDVQVAVAEHVVVVVHLVLVTALMLVVVVVITAPEAVTLLVKQAVKDALVAQVSVLMHVVAVQEHVKELVVVVLQLVLVSVQQAAQENAKEHVVAAQELAAEDVTQLVLTHVKDAQAVVQEHVTHSVQQIAMVNVKLNVLLVLVVLQLARMHVKLLAEQVALEDALLVVKEFALADALLLAKVHVLHLVLDHALLLQMQHTPKIIGVIVDK